MTSGNFTIVPIASITKGDRQRKELRNVPILADSIKRLGLIHPIVVTRGSDDILALVAGERRLEACRLLGRTDIAVQFADDLEESTLHAIELEENVKRENISWQEECAAVARYHEFRRQAEPKWSLDDTAAALGFTPQLIGQRLAVAANLSDPKIAQAEKFSVARGLVRRAEERKATAVLSNIGVSPHETHAPRRDFDSDSPILTADFNEWAPSYAGPKFNLIHCDFPYGIGADKRQQGTSVEAHGGYSDSWEDYETLLRTFVNHCDRFCDKSAHLIFWFSMAYYEETYEILQGETPFEVDAFPLVWHKSDNVGLLPDPSRGPRRIYETAFFGRRGDRKIVQAVGNAYCGPSVREAHMSVKPQAMLEHFFRMLVDSTTTLLDPTCGSGSALRAGKRLGAASLLGLERDEEFADRARRAFKEEPLI